MLKGLRSYNLIGGQFRHTPASMPVAAFALSASIKD